MYFYAKASRAQRKFELRSISDVLELPPADWLIEGLLETGASAVAYGPSGEGKTFVALDWALCIAAGRKWLGRSVRKGVVVYVVAEGGRGIRKRIRAWMQENGVSKIDEAFFVLEAVQLRRSEDYDLLIERLNERNSKPSLIVVDTFARSFVGGDENSSKDVGEFIDASRRLQEHTGAALLAVHHTGKSGDQERGSSAMRAAADAMVRISRSGAETISIDNDKQKDEEECETIRVRLKQVSLDGTINETSCVVVPATAEPEGRAIRQAEQRALDVIEDYLGGAKVSEWRSALEERLEKSVSAKSFDNWKIWLVKHGFVEAIPGQRGYYRAVHRSTPPVDAIGMAAIRRSIPRVP